jgi:hypothetical protein
MSRAFFGAFGKRCHAQICCLRQKVLRPDEGRISRAQSALEQDYQNFCISSSEAGGLPFHHRLHSFTKAQLFLLNARHHVVNALRSERILPGLRAVGPTHEQHSQGPHIKPLHKRTVASYFCQFGTGEARHIEDASSSCNPCESGLVWSRIDV